MVEAHSCRGRFLLCRRRVGRFAYQRRCLSDVSPELRKVLTAWRRGRVRCALRLRSANGRMFAFDPGGRADIPLIRFYFRHCELPFTAVNASRARRCVGSVQGRFDVEGAKKRSSLAKIPNRWVSDLMSRPQGQHGWSGGQNVKGYFDDVGFGRRKRCAFRKPRMRGKRRHDQRATLFCQ